MSTKVTSSWDVIGVDEGDEEEQLRNYVDEGDEEEQLRNYVDEVDEDQLRINVDEEHEGQLRNYIDKGQLTNNVDECEE